MKSSGKHRDPAQQKLNIRGQDRRDDAAEKIRGITRYVRDLQIPGLWVGGTVRSPHPHARILNIHFQPAFNWTQVVVVTARDVPVNQVAMLEDDMPFLADDMVRYAGEAVVLVAAPRPELLVEALSHVRVEYRPLPALLDPLTAENNPIQIYKDNNVFKHITIERGRIGTAREKADRVISLQTRTGYQEHLYLEPQGVIAIPAGDRVTIHGSMQCPYYVKNALVKLFDGQKHITVIQTATGGAFGGKEDYPSLLAGHAALLASKAGKPVGIFYRREEDVQVTPKRHPSFHQDTAYVRADGRILGAELNILLDGGAYCTLSPVVLARSALTALGCYHIPHVRITAKAVATHTVPGGAFRGFGGPQAVFAVEMLIEKIAAETRRPPDEIRRANLIRKGQKTATGQILKYSVSARSTFNDVLRRSRYHQKCREYRRQNTPLLNRLKNGQYPGKNGHVCLKGIGLSAFLHGSGFTGTGENKIQGKIRLETLPDGRVMIYTAATEMGQGEQTAMRSILAKAMGISREQILLSEVNTDVVPDSGPTVASRTTMIIGILLVEAGKEIIATLKTRLREKTGSAFRYVKGNFRYEKQVFSFRQIAREFPGILVEKQYHHPPFIRFDDIHWKGDAYPVFSWAAAVAEVDVDPLTFEVKVTRYTTTHDIGKAINRDQAIAQIQGGSLQGIGYALYEKALLRDGHFDVTGFSDYIIPTPSETPEFDIQIMENPYPYGPFGAKGLGELPLVGAAPAVVSALTMIFGKVFTHIPVLPEDLASIFSGVGNRIEREGSFSKRREQ